MRFQRLLVLAPHTDDAELGCGATMARFLSEGIHLHVAAFSTADDSVPAGSPRTLLRDEFIEAMQRLGLSSSHYTIYDYPVRKLSYHRQEVLEELVRLRKAISPDLVFVPSASDLHQDHQVLFAEGLRAFKDISIWGYELPWNHVTFPANAFVTLEQSHINAKWHVLQAYKSQLDLQRPYFSLEFLEGLARVRGVQVRAQFAEAYEVMRIKL